MNEQLIAYLPASCQKIKHETNVLAHLLEMPLKKATLTPSGEDVKLHQFFFKERICAVYSFVSCPLTAVSYIILLNKQLINNRRKD